MVNNSSGVSGAYGISKYVYSGHGSGDYHLKSISPAIDAGTSIDAPSTDYDNNTRPQGAGFDIGAYEFRSSITIT